jgi:drug/metabolite transporter (DMT)-like permease
LKTKDWAAFIALSLAWGSSFLWIKIGLQELGPITLVALRLLFGILGLLVVVAYNRPKFPDNRRLWGALAILGIIQTALPFLLITWGQQFIDSAVAAILNSTVPLFTMLLAHWYLQDDRLTLQRVIALLIGFFGVVVLLVRDLDGGTQSSLLGQAAVLVAAICYAFSAVFARRNAKGVSPIVQAFVPLLVADALMWALVPLFESPLVLPSLPISWLAILWLGLIGSCIAYLLYYYLLHAIGPTRTTMVTYTFPVVGVALGVIFLNETLDINLLLGAVLVVTSIVIVNRQA